GEVAVRERPSATAPAPAAAAEPSRAGESEDENPEARRDHHRLLLTHARPTSVPIIGGVLGPVRVKLLAMAGSVVVAAGLVAASFAFRSGASSAPGAGVRPTPSIRPRARGGSKRRTGWPIRSREAGPGSSSADVAGTARPPASTGFRRRRAA